MRAKYKLANVFCQQENLFATAQWKKVVCFWLGSEREFWGQATASLQDSKDRKQIWAPVLRESDGTPLWAKVHIRVVKKYVSIECKKCSYTA